MTQGPWLTEEAERPAGPEVKEEGREEGRAAGPTVRLALEVEWEREERRR